MDLDVEEEEDLEPNRPVKRTKKEGKEPLREMAQQPAMTAAAPAKNRHGKQAKRWQKEGLYVGQQTDQPLTQDGKVAKKLQKKRPGSSASEVTLTADPVSATKASMPLPMFGYLEKEKTRDFTIPFDVFAPTARKGDEKPKDWHQLNKNRLVGEAKELWEREEKLARSLCICQPPGPGEQGCDYDCLNRAMHYECNSDNCGLDASSCSNRPFAELAARMKKGGAYDVGVEVIKTQNRGFGVRACRTFAPGQIIMEYTGEIISETECQRRMRELYADKACYYLMEFDKGLIIDGTKGSMARFVNHSCGPNCEVRMVKVNGTPRMGVFAGEDGVMTGEELTYDYNFDNFGSTKQVCYCGAAKCRGYLSKRLNASEQKLRNKEEAERKRKAEQEAARHAEDLERSKAQKGERGSSWRGWVSVAEVKEQLKRERAEKEEAERNSSRAKRLAARRGSLPAQVKEEPEVSKKVKQERRKTTHLETETISKISTEMSESAEMEGVINDPAANRKTYKRTISHGSKFTEELSRPSSSQTTKSSIVKKTEVSITEVREDSVLTNPTSAGAGVTRGVTRGVTCEDENSEEEERVEQPPAKKRKFLKSLVGSVRESFKGTSGVRPGGRLKQSTLSFGKGA